MTSHWKRRGIVPGTYCLQGGESASFAESLVLVFNVWATVVRRETALKYDGFYEERCLFGEDTVLFFRMVLNEPAMVIGPAAVRHNRQDSGLSHTMEHPEAPFFAKPEIILDYCPPEKRSLAAGIIHRIVLRTIHNLARNGYRQKAAELLQRFPESRRFSFLYYQCRVEIALSPILRIWVRFKRFVGLRLRPAANKIVRRLKSRPAHPAAGSNHGGKEQIPPQKSTK